MKYTILKGRKIKKHKYIFYECLVKVKTNIDHYMYVIIPKVNIPIILDLINKDEIESITHMVTFNVIPFEYLPDLNEIENGKLTDVTIYDILDYMDDEEYKELIIDLLKYDCSTIRVKVKG
jgi:hypothetical protein